MFYEGYYQLHVDANMRSMWFKQPIAGRITALINMSVTANHGSWEEFSLCQSGVVQHFKAMELFVPLSMGRSFLPAEVTILEWILKGDSVLPSHSFGQIVGEATGGTLSTEYLPCRGTHLSTKLGVFLSLEQYRSLVTFIGMLSPLKVVDAEDFAWVSDPRLALTGLTAIKETKVQVVKAMLNFQHAIETRLDKEGGEYPLLLAAAYYDNKGLVDQRDGVLGDVKTLIRYVHLHPHFLKEALVRLRAALPPNAAELFRKEDFDENEGVAAWVRFIVKARNAYYGQSTTEFEERIMGNDDLEKLGSEQPLVEAEPEEDNNPELAAPTVNTDSEERRKAKKLAREQKLDTLPNVLEGLDPFEIPILMAKNGGFFEQAFTGTPMVIDRLSQESGEGRQERGKKDKFGFSSTRKIEGAMFLDKVTKGNLVFVNEQHYIAVDERRYSARRMLRTLGHKTEDGRPHLQVLAPHEFGQVPGFVAGQHRDIRDRLGPVVITYDPAMWDLSLADRKTVIGSSLAPKVWVMPRQWLFDLPSGYRWWDAGWFGSPKDPSILDFIVPNGNYDI